MRVHEIARRAGVDSKEVRATVASLGLTVKSASSVVGPPLFAQTVVDTLLARHDGSVEDDGSPCCIAFVTSRGQDHVPGCK